MGPCTGEKTFAGVLPGDRATTIGTKLEGRNGEFVVEQLAQTDSAIAASKTVDAIVSLVDECPAIQAGDFGYGDPVTVSSEENKKIVYFPAFDTDREYGG